MGQNAISDQQQFHFGFMLKAKEAIIDGANQHTFSLIGLDKKALYMTARPGRDRAFINSNQFIETWIEHNDIFNQMPPRIFLIHSDMELDHDDVSQALAITLNNPKKIDKGWQFEISTHVLADGSLHEVVLFLDWPPAIGSPPETVRFELPSLFLDKLPGK